MGMNPKSLMKMLGTMDSKSLERLESALVVNMINQIDKKIKGSGSSILGLTSKFFALGIMSAGISLTIREARKMEIIQEFMDALINHFKDEIDEQKAGNKTLQEEIKKLEKENENLKEQLEKKKGGQTKKEIKSPQK